jgi:uncharacterized protein YndB with AHSA1/START domain
MPVNIDPSGRRWVQIEAEVPGPPEAVWKAIATGPGISAWFVPSTVEEKAGGTATANFGPGMGEASSAISVWDPPRRFSTEMQGEQGPNAPPIATEWTVETRSGGNCIVRVVHSLFADGADWDNQLEGLEHGWPAFFRILRLYLKHFPGQPSSSIQTLGMSPQPSLEAWATLTSALGLAGAKLGQKVRSTSGATPLGGLVEGVGVEGHPELLLRLDEPAPGVAHMFPLGMGEQTFVSFRIYLYGQPAAAAAAHAEPLWQAWISERFPTGGAVLNC